MTNPDLSSYAKVFVRASLDDTIRMVEQALFTSPVDGVMEVDGVVLDVRRNPDLLPDAADFLFWPVIADAEATDPEISHEEFVDVLTKLLHASWSCDMPMVVAGDVEALLPWSGGIERVR